jgi:integrase
MLPELVETLKAGPTGDLAFIVGERGNPMTTESFGNWFREACDKAGCPGSAHGLRKALATRLANEGATSHELEALFGWRGGGMASLYTRKANRTKLAGSAMDKLLGERAANNLSPHLRDGSPHLKNKP